MRSTGVPGGTGQKNVADSRAGRSPAGRVSSMMSRSPRASSPVTSRARPAANASAPTMSPISIAAIRTHPGIERALDCPGEGGRRDGLARRRGEPIAGADTKLVPPSTGRDRWGSGRDLGNQLGPLGGGPVRIVVEPGTDGPLEREVVVERGIGRPGIGLDEDPCHPLRRVRGGTLRLAALDADPDPVVGERHAPRCLPDRDRRRDPVRHGIDPADGPVQAVRDPHRARPRGHPGRVPPHGDHRRRPLRFRDRHARRCRFGSRRPRWRLRPAPAQRGPGPPASPR